MKHICGLIVLLLVFTLVFQSTITTPSTSNPDDYKKRILQLEPKEPVTFYQFLPDRDLSKFKKTVNPISDAIRKGQCIEFKSVYHDPGWKRPAYHANWHSTYFRWSNVPRNLAYQQHQVFSYQGGASWWFDLSGELSLPEKSYVPSPINDYAFTVKYPFVTRLIVINAKVIDIKLYGNQLVTVVKPSRTGLHVIDFDHKEFQNKTLLLQMSTTDGEELDYLILNT